jgi:uncharacterized membrane protein
MIGPWFHEYGIEFAALAFNSIAFASYRALQRRRGRLDPSATLQSEQAAVRTAWVAELISTGNGILGVQTLRNAIMGAVFFASNTMFLVIGTLSLTAQKQLGESWAALNPGGAHSTAPTQAKLLLLLLTLLFAFFCFINAIRLFEHASVSIGCTTSIPERVTAQVNAAWRYQGLGVRCYYFAAPILFWLFGALWFVLAGIAAIVLMHVIDRASTTTSSN